MCGGKSDSDKYEIKGGEYNSAPGEIPIHNIGISDTESTGEMGRNPGVYERITNYVMPLVAPRVSIETSRHSLCAHSPISDHTSHKKITGCANHELPSGGSMHSCLLFSSPGGVNPW